MAGMFFSVLPSPTYIWHLRTVQVTCFISMQCRKQRLLRADWICSSLCFTGLINPKISMLGWNSNPIQRSQLLGFSSSPLQILRITCLSYFLCNTCESENVFLIVAEHILSSITMKEKEIQGPSLVCKTMHHIFHRVSFPIANGEGMENTWQITALNNLVLLNSDCFDLVPRLEMSADEEWLRCVEKLVPGCLLVWAGPLHCNRRSFLVECGNVSN